MKINKYSLLLLLCCGFIAAAFGQKKKNQKEVAIVPTSKKNLTHDVYDFWKDIPERTISNDGSQFVYAVNPQEGDGKLYFKNLIANTFATADRGYESRITYDSKNVVFKIKPMLNAVKEAKRAKKKKEDMPKDSLGVFDFVLNETTKFANIISYKIPEKAGGWLAYLGEKSKEKIANSKADSTQSKQKKAVKKENEDNGYRLILRNLALKSDKKYDYVKEYELSKNGLYLSFSTSGNDSLQAGVYVLELNSQKLTTVYAGHAKHKFKKLTFDETGEQLAFLADLDTNSKTQIRYPKLFYWKNTESKATLLVDESNLFSQKSWILSQETTPKFSKNRQKLFFGTNPPPIIADTTLLPDEIVNVEVWNWNDRKLQTQQKVSLENDKKKSYWAVVNLEDKKIVQLSDLSVPDVELVNEGNSNFVVGRSDLKYTNQHWDWNSKQDIYLINVADGSKKIVKEKLEGSVVASPEGKYLHWFSDPDTAWFAYQVSTGTIQKLTNAKTVKFADEEDDHPDFPKAYGLAGWTKNDQYMLVYDRYDIWQIDPANSNATKLTNGRAQQKQYRYVKLDPEVRGIDTSKPILLRTVDENTKQEGFAMLSGNSISGLYEGDFKIGNTVLKAKNAPQILFTKETFKNYPDWYSTDFDFKYIKKQTDANPQQADYLWGSVESVSWVANDGTPLKGLLYKPENFDATKKYPMMTYFYEKNSENIHSHFAPRPIRSYLNFSYFASNGYLVFVPDIVYKTGYPGQSAYNCVVPGVLSIIAKGFVDKDKIGVSGHSWGGYQSAYLITQTNIFRAAEAGAPVANMTSAYGGVRWESGASRQAQYEKTQTRIGGTLWEKPMLYIENSPLFYTPKIQTPVLMMHNDDDGAVPWYQGIEFYMALKRLNKPVWLLNYNGEKHGLTKRQNMKDFTVRLYQYFDYYLKDAPAPSWMSDGLPMVEKGIKQHLETTNTAPTGKLGKM
jgi:dipeptidyl aminopeptidase/acylaminoacyl peptidase